MEKLSNRSKDTLIIIKYYQHQYIRLIKNVAGQDIMIWTCTLIHHMHQALV